MEGQPGVNITIGDNHFKADAFNEHLLEAFRVWAAALKPGTGQEEVDALTKKLEDQSSGLAAGVEESTT